MSITPFVRRCLLFLVALLPTASSAATLQATGPEWVVMVFMNGDNDLELDALTDFAEMAAIGSSNRIKILVQFDRNGRFATTNPQWTQTLRFEVTRNMVPTPANALEDLGEINMGSPDALADFIRWGRRRYPTGKHAVIVWDHGQGYRLRLMRAAQTVRALRSSIGTVAAAPSGPGGYRSVSDDLTDQDKLYNAELATALTSALAGGRLDLLGFDACLMAMVETAYGMRSHARVMVGSEDLEPGEGWRYDDWLRRMTDLPNVSAEQLGDLLVESYGATTGLRPGTTLSSVSLTDVDAAASAISTLADKMTSLLDRESGAIAAARAACQNYAPSIREIYHIDLIRFARELASRASDRELVRLANVTADTVEALVLRRFAHADREGEFGSHGLAIYFPATLTDFQSDPYQENGYIKTNSFFPVPFVREHRWADFLQTYYGSGGGAPTPPLPPAQAGVPQLTPQSSSFSKLAEKITTQAGVLSGVRDASLTSNVDSGEPSVVLLASNDGVTAKARMGYLVSGKSLADVTFTGPVKGGQAVLLDRQGLGNKASVEARFTVIPWSRVFLRDERGTANRLRSGDTSFSGFVAEALRDAEANERVRLGGSARTPFRGSIPADSPGLERSFSDVWRRQYLAAGKVQVQSAMLVSGTYTSGANSLPYLDPTTFETKPFASRSEGVAGTVGWMQAQGKTFAEAIPRSYFGFSVEGTRSYRPQSARNICKPITDSAATECFNMSVGEPITDRVLSLQGEARVWLKAKTLAVGTRFTYEEQRKGAKEPTRLLEFPFYFLKKVAKVDELPKPGDTPPFTGGVNLGWRSEKGERNFFVLLFVGSTFGLPGIP